MLRRAWVAGYLIWWSDRSKKTGDCVSGELASPEFFFFRNEEKYRELRKGRCQSPTSPLFKNHGDVVAWPVISRGSGSTKPGVLRPCYPESLKTVILGIPMISCENRIFLIRYGTFTTLSLRYVQATVPKQGDPAADTWCNFLTVVPQRGHQAGSFIARMIFILQGWPESIHIFLSW
jgi:hypothetical protein